MAALMDRDLLAGVGDDQLVTGCADVGECVGALDLAGVDDDLAARKRERRRPRRRAHRRA